jgi:hypothetical protein
MRINYFLAIIALFTLTLAGCSKSDDNVNPSTAPVAADLLVRTWAFSDFSVQTDVKKYQLPAKLPNGQGLLGDDNVVTFKKDGTYSYLDNKTTVTGKWTLSDKTLVMIDADNSTSTWTVNTLSATDLNLASIVVNLQKGNNLNDSKVYSKEEASVGGASVLLLATLDKSYGGTIDFSKEPAQKTVQLLVNGKAK